MELCLHRGAKEVDFGVLATLETPAPTHSHVPLPHVELVNMVKYALGYYGHEVVEEAHAITDDGMRYFGLLSLRSPYHEYTDTLGLRNSHDKTFPIGLSAGSRVFVCDNLSFIGDHVIRRKHTTNSRRDLPGLVAAVIEPLQLQRQKQHECFERYQRTELSSELADHAILSMYRKGVLNIQRVPDVVQQWENPAHDWGDRTAWRLFNAATYALKGRIAENPSSTRQLHNVMDAVVETVH